MKTMAIATGQFTIIDHNDAATLTGFISSNQSKTQGYSPDTGVYSPDYSKTNLVLKANMFAAGSSEDLLDSGDNVSKQQWYTNTNGAWTPISSATSRSYTLNTNLGVNENSKEFRYSCVYTDPATQLPLDFNVTIEIVKVINGSGIADAVITAVNGNIFKNGQTTSLTAECQLWLGSSIATTGMSTANFKWFKQKTGGAGNTQWGVPAGWEEVTGHAWNAEKKASVLTVTPDMVQNMQVFWGVVKDPNSNSYFKDTITFVDQTDPIQVTIHSTGGSIFKNGEGTTDLTAKLYQNGVEIDKASPYRYTYTWKKYDNAGSIVSSFVKTGKKITVTDADVDVKATFIVEIS